MISNLNIIYLSIFNSIKFISILILTYVMWKLLFYVVIWLWDRHGWSLLLLLILLSNRLAPLLSHRRCLFLFFNMCQVLLWSTLHNHSADIREACTTSYTSRPKTPYLRIRFIILMDDWRLRSLIQFLILWLVLLLLWLWRRLIFYWDGRFI